MEADMRAITRPGMHASQITPVSLSDQPDAAEVSVKMLDYTVGNNGKLYFQGGRFEK
jgi:hypothetical protein